MSHQWVTETPSVLLTPFLSSFLPSPAPRLDGSFAEVPRSRGTRTTNRRPRCSLPLHSVVRDVRSVWTPSPEASRDLSLSVGSPTHLPGTSSRRRHRPQRESIPSPAEQRRSVHTAGHVSRLTSHARGPFPRVPLRAPGAQTFEERTRPPPAPFLPPSRSKNLDTCPV